MLLARFVMAQGFVYLTVSLYST